MTPFLPGVQNSFLPAAASYGLSENGQAQLSNVLSKLGLDTIGENVNGAVDAIGQTQALADPASDIWSNRLKNIGSAVNIGTNLFNVYQGMKAMGLAKDEFGLRKRAFETNLQNQFAAIKAQTEDTMRARGKAEGSSQAETQQAIADRLASFRSS